MIIEVSGCKYTLLKVLSKCMHTSHRIALLDSIAQPAWRFAIVVNDLNSSFFNGHVRLLLKPADKPVLAELL